MKTFVRCLVPLLAVLFVSSASAGGSNWRSKLQKQLSLLGHRNWIVVADSAYPLQTAPGIETIYTDASQLEVVEGVLAELAKTRHVASSIYTDAELGFVHENGAAGIGSYRDALAKLLEGKNPQSLPHEEIIAKLDEAGKAFKVLIIKTPLTLPYTSVFFQLECGYWTADSEKQLREAMRAGATAP